MNQNDQLQIEALLNAFGTQPFGSPGFNPFMGGIPPMADFPQGSTFAGSSPVYGPMLHNPHHLSFGQGTIGRMLGFGLEQFAAGQGYTYMPQGVGVVDVMRGRAMEMGLQRAGQIGAGIDENRLAQAIERGLRPLLGQSLGVSAHAHAVASSVYGPLEQMGLLRQILPGGTAADFSRQMYMAGQNVRDYTRQNFKLGLNDPEVFGMTRRLLDYFAPTGTVDIQRTRGMGLGDLGQLAGSLSSFGLVNVDVSRGDLERVAQRAGMDPRAMSSGELNTLKDSARALNVGKQLQDYSEIIGAMREIVGDPNAPIPQMITNLQQMTGNNMQNMRPDNVLRLLDRVREVSRTANITMDAMMEIAKMGAVQFQQQGFSGVAGANAAMSAYSAAVASQNVVGGAFPGRMTTQQVAENNMRLDMQGRTSPAARVSTQTLRMLESVNFSSLNDSQRATYNQLRSLAENTQLGDEMRVDPATGKTVMYDQNWVMEKLQTLGVSPGRASDMLTSPLGASDMLDKNPALNTALRRGQFREAQRDLGRFGEQIFLRMQNGGDALAEQLSTAGATAGLSGQQLASSIARAFQETDGSASGVADYLKRNNGITLSERQVAAFRDQLANFRPAREYIQEGMGIRGDTPEKMFRQISQQFGLPTMAAQQELERTQELGIKGANMLRQLNVEFRGGTMERLVGAMMEGKTGVAALAHGLGFTPTDEVLQKLKNAGMGDFMASFAKYQTAVASGDPMAVRAAQSDLMRGATAMNALVGEGGPLAGLFQAKASTNLSKTIDANTQQAARVLNRVDASPEEKKNAMQKIATMAKSWSIEDIEEMGRNMGGADGAHFSFLAKAMKSEADSVQYKIAQIDKETDPGRKKQLMDELMGNSLDMYQAAGGVMSAVGMQNEYDMSRGLFDTTRSRMQLLGEASQATEEFMKLNKEDLSTPMGRSKLLRMMTRNRQVGDVFFDKDGNVRDELINDMVANNKTLKTEEERMAYAEKLEKTIMSFKSDRQRMSLPALMMNDKDAIDLYEGMHKDKDRGITMDSRDASLFSLDKLRKVDKWNAERAGIVGSDEAYIDPVKNKDLFDFRAMRHLTQGLLADMSTDMSTMEGTPEERARTKAALLGRRAESIIGSLRSRGLMEGNVLTDKGWEGLVNLHGNQAEAIARTLQTVAEAGGYTEDLEKKLIELAGGKKPEEKDESKGAEKKAEIEITDGAGNALENGKLIVTIKTGGKDSGDARGAAEQVKAPDRFYNPMTLK